MDDSSRRIRFKTKYNVFLESSVAAMAKSTTGQANTNGIRPRTTESWQRPAPRVALCLRFLGTLWTHGSGQQMCQFSEALMSSR
ncbi:unnamed protein product [Caenorhabditis nigoni]